jgi:PleD family two-component response regulator
MSRILLADDSSHAQRMGERILREEGFEVVSLTDGETVLLRLNDADPDVILADVFLPGKSGFEICRYVKSHLKHRHVRVVMTAGLLEPFDEEEATRAGCDGILKKPFEATLLVQTIKPLIMEAQLARGLFAEQVQETSSKPVTPPRPARQPPPAQPEVDVERVHAAITVALDAALPALIHEITERVLIALGH